MTGAVQPADYVQLLDAVKREVAVSRARAARVVNTELIGMYWRIGRLILDRQADEGWGARVIERLAADLLTAFPGARGFSRRNLHYMRALGAAWPQVVPQPVAQLAWGTCANCWTGSTIQPLVSGTPPGRPPKAGPGRCWTR